jgi:hypothetical protein
VGETPLLNFALEAGPHRVHFVNSETHATTDRSVDVKPAARAKVQVSW